MALLDLPTELILMIERYLPQKTDVSALMRSHPRTLAILQQSLYNRAEGREIDSNLRWACKWGNERLAFAMLSMGADVTSDIDGTFVPLSIAALYGQLNMVKFLLKYDPKTIHTQTSTSPIRGSAIMCATIQGDIEIVEFLLAQPDLDPQKPNECEVFILSEKVDMENREIFETPIDQAIYDGNRDLVRILLADCRVKLSAWSLHAAVKGGHEDMVRLTLLQYPQENVPDHRPALSVAVWYNHTAVVKLLLEVAQQEVSTEWEHGANPVFISAAYRETSESDNLLLAKDNIDIKYSDEFGRTAFIISAINGNLEIAKMLRDTEEFDVESPDSSGRTPLSYATKHGEDLVLFLLSFKNVNPVSKDYDGRTPFHYAVSHNNVPAMKALLSSGKIDINEQDASGRTPLFPTAGYHDREERRKEAIEFLLSLKDLQPHLKNHIGQTPSHFAAKHGAVDTLKMLLETGDFDLNVPDDEGLTPLFYAVRYGSEYETRTPSELNSDQQATLTLLRNRALYPFSPTQTRIGEPDNWRWDAHTTLSMMRQLLALGKVDPNVRDSSGLTPLLWAVENSKVHVVKLLLSNERVDLEKKHPLGWTALEWAQIMWAEDNGESGI